MTKMQKFKFTFNKNILYTPLQSSQTKYMYKTFK